MDRRPGTSLLLVVLVGSVLVGGVTGVAAGERQVIGRPVLDVSAPENVVTPGTETTLDLYVSNEGEIRLGGSAEYVDRVTTARGTSVTVEAGDAPVEIITDTRPVGTVPTGTSGPHPIRLAVDADAEPGTYTLPVELRYTYTSLVSDDGTVQEPDPSFSETTVTRTAEVTIRVEHRPRFRVVGTSSSLRAGESGTLSVTLRNDGTRTAREAAVVLTSDDTALRFGPETGAATAGDTSSAREFVGRWRPGESRTVTVEARSRDDDAVRAYPFHARVAYEDDRGVAKDSRILTASVRPDPAPAFAVRDADDSLRVGRTGSLSGRLVNVGDVPVSDAVVRVSTDADAHVVDPTYPVGDLAPGESARFSVEVRVPADASAGPKRFDVRVEHASATGDRTTSDPVGVVRTVAPKRDPFRVDPVAATFDVNTDGRLVVDLTNTDDEPATSIRARFAAADPLSSDAPGAYVSSLDPNETARVSFAVSVSDEAVASTYPAALNVTYTDADGDTQVAEPIPFGVAVTEPETSVPLALVGAVLAVVLVGAAWWVLRR